MTGGGDDDSTLFTLGNDADQLLNSVLSANKTSSSNGASINNFTSGSTNHQSSLLSGQQPLHPPTSTTTTTTKPNNTNPSNNFDDLLFSSHNNNRSNNNNNNNNSNNNYNGGDTDEPSLNDESTALGSLLVPNRNIMTSSQIRSNAPRVTTTTTEQQIHQQPYLNGGGSGFNAINNNNQQQQQQMYFDDSNNVNSSSQQQQSHLPVLDEPSVDSNRPFDQLIISPDGNGFVVGGNSGNNSNHLYGGTTTNNTGNNNRRTTPSSSAFTGSSSNNMIGGGQLSSHRQRRQYRTNATSSGVYGTGITSNFLKSSDGSISKKSYRSGNNNNHSSAGSRSKQHRPSAYNNSNNNSILETLGLSTVDDDGEIGSSGGGNDFIHDDGISALGAETFDGGGGGGGNHNDYHYDNNGRKLSSSLSRHNSNSNNNTSKRSTILKHQEASRRHHHHHHRRNKRGNSKHGSNARALLMMCFLIIMVYCAIQLSTMVKHNTELERTRANDIYHHHNYHHNNIRRKNDYDEISSSATTDAFSEGIDRPMSAHAKELLDTHGSDPSDIALKQVKGKVPLQDNGPEHGRDYTSTAAEDNNGDGGDAPVDVLPDVEEDADGEEEEGSSTAGEEEGKEAEVSTDVQLGFAGVYTKDKKGLDIPFLWYIPRSGSGIMKNIASQCRTMVIASEVGGTIKKEHLDDEEEGKGGKKLDVVNIGGHSYVNVDTATSDGIKEAKELNLVDSGLANLIVSPRITEAASLFSNSRSSGSSKGRVFTIMRHPVERAVSMYYFLKKNKIPQIVKLSIEEYAKSQYVENNWMVRVLSGKMEGEVGDVELKIAKETLRTKVIIGLLEQKELSIRRFEYYFNWEYDDINDKNKKGVRQNACRKRIINGDLRKNESSKNKIKENSQGYSLLLWQNKLDMKLYKYAKKLFIQQSTELFSELD